jgi:polynucleotide 5'-kinase involved in rRNA processing
MQNKCLRLKKWVGALDADLGQGNILSSTTLSVRQIADQKMNHMMLETIW